MNTQRKRVILPLFIGFIIVLLPILFYTLIKNDNKVGAWYNTSWNFRKKIVIDESLITVTSNESNFPILININDSDLASKANSDGSDIRFTDEDGTTLLEYDIEAYNQGKLTAWVEIPTLSYNTDTQIFMYYGNSTATSAEDSTAVFGSDENYVGVYYMNTTPTSTLSDASSYSNDLTSGGSMTSDDLVNGEIDKGLEYDGTNDYLTRTDDSDFDFAASDTWYATTWVNAAVQAGGSSEDTYYFDAHNAGIALANSPNNLDDGSTSTFANNGGNDDNQRQTTNTCDATCASQTDTITKVELRIHGCQNAGNNGGMSLTPYFNGSTAGDPYYWMDGDIPESSSCTTSGSDWSSYYDITSDSQAPGTWTWSDIQNLDVDLFTNRVGGADVLFASKIEIRVTSSTLSPQQIINKADTSTGGWKVYFDDTGNVCFGIDDDSSWTPDDEACSSGTDYLDGANHFIAVYKNGTTGIYLYIDGALAASDTSIAATGTLANTNALYTGIDRDGSTEPFEGIIDNVVIRKDTASAELFETIYNNQNSGSGLLSFSGEQIQNGPMFYLKLDEATGTTIHDSSGNDYTATFTGTPDWQPEDMCVSGSCLFFNGSNEYAAGVETPPTEDLTGFSACAWVKPLSDGGSNTGEIFFMDGSYLRTDTESNGTVEISGQLSLSTTNATYNTTQTIPLIEWSHVCMTYTDDADDELTIYINGVAVGSSTDGSGGLSPTTLPSLGGTASLGFHGFIDEFKTYGYERNADQILSDYINLAGPKGSTATFGPSNSYLSNGLIAHWPMDEGGGGTCSDGADTCDKAGYGYNLDWNDGIDAEVGKYGKSADHDGTNDKLDCTDATCGGTSGLDFTASDSFTYSMWINTSDTGVQDYLMGKQGSSGNPGWAMYINTSEQVVCELADASTTVTATGTSDIRDGTWHFTTCVVDKNTQQLSVYADGVLEASSDISAVTGTHENAFAFMIGSDSEFETYELTGFADEARIYKLALTEKEVGDLYQWAPGPLMHYKFDEGTGTSKSYDSSGNGYDLDLVSITESSWVPGIIGGALRFDGSADYGIVTGEGDATSNNAFSASAWVYREADSGISEHIFGNWDTTDDGWRLLVGSSDIFGCSYNATNALSSTTVALNTWYHVECTSNGSELILYVNGIQEDSTSITGDIDETNDLRIGVLNSGAQWFAGIIDDARVYTYARSQEQVLEDMNAGHPIGGSPVGSPLAHWKFDEGYGTTANDSSSNSNDLTLSTSSWTNDGKYNKAWDGDGSKYLSRADDADFDFTASEDFSISVWVKSDSASNPSDLEFIVDKESGDGYGVYFDTSGYPVFATYDSTPIPITDTASGTTDIYDGTWHHIVSIKNGTSSLKIYVDGREVGSNTSITVTQDLSNSDSLTVGDRNASDDGDEFFGDIDELKIYRSALTSAQVLTEYNHGKAATFGAISTESDGTTVSNAASREYCVPGDTSTCNTPVGEWKFDENSGTSSTYDTSGYDNTGSLNSITENSWVPGVYGSALDLDGSADFIQISDADELSFGDSATDTALTFSAWINPDEATNFRILGKANFSGVEEYILRTDTSDKLNVRLYDDAAYIGRYSDTTIAQDTWSYVTATYDASGASSGIKLYINGIEVTTTDDSSGSYSVMDNGTEDLFIGRNFTGGSVYSDGTIDQVRMYNYVRTPAQIAWEYSSGKPIGWWKLDDCQGTTAYDSSGNGYNGTITIGATGTNTSEGTCSSGTSTEAWNNGTSGKRNYSIDLDSTDDWIDMGDFFYSDPFTVCAWINADTLDSNARSIVIKRNNTGTVTASSTNEWQLIAESAVVKFSVWDSVPAATLSLTGSSTLSTGTWYHVCGVSGGASSTGYIYVNGVEDDQGSQTNARENDSVNAVQIGARTGNNNNRYWDGQIDDVKIWNYPLTPAQIKLDYNEGAVNFLN